MHSPISYLRLDKIELVWVVLSVSPMQVYEYFYSESMSKRISLCVWTGRYFTATLLHKDKYDISAVRRLGVNLRIEWNLERHVRLPGRPGQMKLMPYLHLSVEQENLLKMLFSSVTEREVRYSLLISRINMALVTRTMWNKAMKPFYTSKNKGRM